MLSLLIFGLIDVGDTLIVHLFHLVFQLVVFFLQSVDKLIGFIELAIQVFEDGLSLFDLLLHAL